MSEFLTVETTTRWETSSLLRKLRGHHAYAIQVGREQWLVRSPVDASSPNVSELEAIVSQWAAEEGTPPRRLHLDSGHLLLRH
jgi:hypothetical protein